MAPPHVTTRDISSLLLGPVPINQGVEDYIPAASSPAIQSPFIGTERKSKLTALYAQKEGKR